MMTTRQNYSLYRDLLTMMTGMKYRHCRRKSGMTHLTDRMLGKCCWMTNPIYQTAHKSDRLTMMSKLTAFCC
jgi:hypothetical protein